MPSSVMGQWTEGAVKMLGVWFDPEPQTEKNWSVVVDRVTTLIQIWPGKVQF